MIRTFRWRRLLLAGLMPLAVLIAGCGGSGSVGGGDGGSGGDSGGGGEGGGDTAASTWSAQAYVKASNADAGDRFGTSVALSGDTLVVSAIEESSSQTTITNGATASADNSASAAGAVYVYVRSGTGWSEQAYLKAPNAEAGDGFGTSVAISGDTLVVGAESEASNQATITHGNTASADNSASGAGAVYVFVRNGTSWSQQAYLKAPNAEADDLFGHSVAIDGGTIVVGANTESSSQTTITNGSTASTDNSAPEAGAAYVFVRSGTNWNQQAYLKAPNAEAADNFGVSVGISGDTIVVGADNEASPQTTITNGPTASPDNAGIGLGAAYVFVRSGSNWSQQAYLKAPNVNDGDNFGFSVAISGDTIVVGARKEDSAQATITHGSTASSDNSAPDAGAAYVFERSGTNWSQQAYLKAANAETIDNFGTSVAISGDTIAVGAYLEDSAQTTITNGSSASSDNAAPDAGAAYVFVRSGTSWNQQAYLKAANAESNDELGTGVAISGSTVAVGAHDEASRQTTITHGNAASADNTATAAGAAYVFQFGN